MDVGWCTSNISCVVRPLLLQNGRSRQHRKTLRGTRTGRAGVDKVVNSEVDAQVGPSTLPYPLVRIVAIQPLEVPIPLMGKSGAPRFWVRDQVSKGSGA